MAEHDGGQWYLVPQSVYAPVVLSGLAIVGAVVISRWALVTLPFLWLGAWCAAPNLNLVNGCLAYLAMILGFVVAQFHEPLGFAILIGAASGFYGGAFEKRLRMRPYPGEQ